MQVNIVVEQGQILLFSVLFLGICKFVLAVSLGDILLDVLKNFPNPVLGALLAMSGLELASSCKDQNDKVVFVECCSKNQTKKLKIVSCFVHKTHKTQRSVLLMLSTAGEE